LTWFADQPSRVAASSRDSPSRQHSTSGARYFSGSRASSSCSAASASRTVSSSSAPPGGPSLGSVSVGSARGVDRTRDANTVRDRVEPPTDRVSGAQVTGFAREDEQRGLERVFR